LLVYQGRASGFLPIHAPTAGITVPEGSPMRCPRCEADTPDGAKFCIECGTPLKPRCPQCGVDTLPRAKFCGECGTPRFITASVDLAGTGVKGGKAIERTRVRVLRLNAVGQVVGLGGQGWGWSGPRWREGFSSREGTISSVERETE
jgi:hypothetical protein